MPREGRQCSTGRAGQDSTAALSGVHLGQLTDLGAECVEGVQTGCQAGVYALKEWNKTGEGQCVKKMGVPEQLGAACLGTCATGWAHLCRQWAMWSSSLDHPSRCC